MKKLLTLFLAPVLALAVNVNDIKVSQVTKANPPSYIDRIFAPVNSGLWGFDSSGQPVAFTIGTNLTLVGTTLNANTGALNILATGFVFSNNGAIISRLNDRLFIGGATLSDGAFPQVANDWLATYLLTNGYSSYAIAGDLAVETGTNHNDASAILGATRTLNFTSAGTSGLGITSFAINNNVTYPTQAWAYYGEAHKVNATVGAVYGMELDTKTLVASIAPTPYLQGDVVTLQLASGAGISTGPAQFDASAAIQIQANPKKFKAGIVFGSTALAGNDGTTGSAPAILMPNGDRIDWYSPNTNLAADITSNVTTTTLGTRVVFDNAGTSFEDYQNNPVLTIASSATAIVDKLTVAGGVSGSNTVALTASGSDSNIDIDLTPAGTGRVVTGLLTTRTQVTNGNTALFVTPNGTGTQGNLDVFAGSDTANTNFVVIRSGSTTAINSTKNGTGTAQNLGIEIGGASVASFTPSAIIGSHAIVSISATEGVGYFTGAGGTITQSTDKTTGVTINKVTGQITMNNAALAASTSVGFTVTDSAVASVDTVIANIGSGATVNSYTVTVDAIGSGSFHVHLRNVSGGSLSEALVLNFCVIKGASS